MQSQIWDYETLAPVGESMFFCVCVAIRLVIGGEDREKDEEGRVGDAARLRGQHFWGTLSSEETWASWRGVCSGISLMLLTSYQRWSVELGGKRM